MLLVDRRYVILIAQLITPFIAAWAIFYYATIPLMILALVMWFLMRCIGSVITYHRIHGHNTHAMHPVVEAICTALGFYGALSSPIQFCSVHTHHHKYTDTEKDPHPFNLKGWKVLFPIFWNDSGVAAGDLRTIVRLRKNKIANFFHEYYWLLLPLPLLLIFISWEIFLFAYMVPLAFTLISLAISTLNHDKNGGPKYMGELFGIITLGEHHHKWHHDHPNDTTGEGWLNTVIELIAKKRERKK